MTIQWASIEVPPRLARPSRRLSLYELNKRIVDLVVSVSLLLVLLPALLLVALLIKLDSPGPALFRQERVGGKRFRSRLAGEDEEPHTFRLVKFRSMVDGADPTAHQEHIRRYIAGELQELGDTGSATFKLSSDARVTTVGRFLRRTSIDELPQLLNVLRGDMSLVGPRPVPLYEAAAYSQEQRERFNVPGGISGLWQVQGRSGVSFQEMIRLDLEYVRQRSTWLDLKIILRTIPTLISRRGAA